MHHSPNFEAAVSEVYRVLRPGGIAKVMIYQRYSIVGMMLWFRYGLLRGRPLLSLDYIYDKYLESPETKAYSVSEAKEIFKNFSNLSITTKLSFGDLLQGEVGQRHRGVLLSLGKLIWPRHLLNRYFSRFGLLLLITAKR